MKRILVISISLILGFSAAADTLLSYSSENAAWPEPKSRDITEQFGQDDITYSSRSERGEFILKCAKDGNTRYYLMKSEETGEGIEASLEGNTIIVDIVREGTEEHKELTMEDDLPWYQSFDIQFADFALSGEKKREFYMIRPDDLSLTTWQLKRQGVEKVETPAGTFDAVKVKVSLAGMLSMFWSAECWYRVSDGRFIKYEGPMGGPGSDEVVSLLASEQPM